MKIKKFRYFVGDFETTVYQNQTYTEVWASASVELFTEDVKIFHSIDEQFEYFINLNENIIVYYHNLKFDGEFWLYYLLCKLKYKQAYNSIGEREIDVEWQHDNYMKNKTFKYSISDMGQWSSIIIKVNNHYIEIRDSLKLLPFSVSKIGKSFGTKHKKLDMEYTGFRYAGCEITEHEKEYISNDILVVKEALEIMFKQGHKSLTIGSCCLKEYKSIIGKERYKKLFPQLYDIIIDDEIYKCKTAGDYIRKSYRGGWCYVVKGKENRVVKNGTTADVNSLYPSMMSSESGKYYPIGTPNFWSGNYIPDEAKINNRYYFLRIKTRFYIKPNKLPFIQIKNNLLYNGNECLTTSDVYDKTTNQHYREYIGFDNNIEQAIPELVLTITDYKLLQEHYYLEDFEILDGCWFETEIGIFDEYINKYKKIKMESKGAIRELAKLFLNNLYGKMASSPNSSFKIAYIKEDKTIGYLQVIANDKEAGFIAVGSAITSYARNFTIRTAQANYYGVNNRGFIYADTDSVHCDIPQKELKNIKIHNTDFCCWKIESYWDEAIFVRPKTYIEHVTHEEGTAIDNPYHLIKCAGMPDKCKKLFEHSLLGSFTKEKLDKLPNEKKINAIKILETFNAQEKEFVSTKRTLTDFSKGLIVPSKLRPKHIMGGILLVDTTYEMR